ncbi:MAG: hypothetical protein Q4G25_06425 [Paracoccus sp. (in: a-proteobacteria)]|nr:hypothetical protein [Paracoccus sp. (in: a-proteobacteria)]
MAVIEQGGLLGDFGVEARGQLSHQSRDPAIVGGEDVVLHLILARTRGQHCQSDISSGRVMAGRVDV